MQKKSLQEVRAILHDLLNNLPAVRVRCSEEVLRRHLQLIDYYQRQYEMLTAQAQPQPN